MQPVNLELFPRRRVLTVSELTETIRTIFDTEFRDIWVAGEVSGVRLAPSGHCYFTLKDGEAQLQCACFRNSMRFVRFKPKDGLEILARGRVDVYAERGQYQLIVETIEPRGLGALQLAFEQLKKKLAAEGLFETARKRPLPKFPRRIGIVTSPAGAAIQDMLQILARRFPGLHIRIYPALVQGEGSVEQVCRGIQYFSKSPWAEVVIVARGGGSLEDLWTFNEEAVVRAIAGCSVPVVSAVGHETDFTIADFVADLRAPTPSAAAELIVVTREQVLEQITALERHLKQGLQLRLGEARRRLHAVDVERVAASLHRSVGKRVQRVDDLEFRAWDRLRTMVIVQRRRLGEVAARLEKQDLRLRLADGKRRLEAAETALAQRMHLRLARAMGRVVPLEAHLRQLSPLAVLERGYAIVEDAQRHVVKDAAEVAAEAKLSVRLAKGRLEVRVVSQE
jgi:exodeoxyribonuclease VII large subunit